MDVSSEHTPINLPSRKSSFNLCVRICVEGEERSRFTRYANGEWQTKNPKVLGAESWIGRSKRKVSSVKIIRSWSRNGDQKLWKEKFWYCSLWDESRVRVPTITATTGESMGWSGAKRQNLFLGELEMKNRLFRENRAKDCQLKKNWGEFLAKKQIIQLDKQELMNCVCIKRGILLLWGTFWLKFRNYRSKWIPCQMRENFTILKQRAALERPTFSANPGLFRVPEQWLAAILDCRMTHGKLWVLQETFAREGPPSALFEITEFGIIFPRIETWHCRKYNSTGKGNEKGTSEFVNTCTTLPKRRWSIESYLWTYSQGCVIDYTRFPFSENASG